MSDEVFEVLTKAKLREEKEKLLRDENERNTMRENVGISKLLSYRAESFPEIIEIIRTTIREGHSWIQFHASESGIYCKRGSYNNCDEFGKLPSVGHFNMWVQQYEIPLKVVEAIVHKYLEDFMHKCGGDLEWKKTCVSGISITWLISW